MKRRILIVTNPHRPDSEDAGRVVARELERAGIEACFDFEYGASDAIEAAIVLGGDGTMLHAAGMIRGADIPLLGVNLGRVGFLAELDREDVAHAVTRLAAGDYNVERRGTLAVSVTHLDGSVEVGWALNEATLERANLRRTLEVAVEVDGKPLSRYGCDGVIVSTATGSTAHAFSAGGPVMWPNVDALLLVPLAAHALFARPLVVGPESFFTVEVSAASESDAEVVLDGARALSVERGGVLEVRRGQGDVLLARLSDAPFTDRLVNKFSLPTDGWRGERAKGRVESLHEASPPAPDEDG